MEDFSVEKNDKNQQVCSSVWLFHLLNCLTHRLASWSVLINEYQVLYGVQINATEQFVSSLWADLLCLHVQFLLKKHQAQTVFCQSAVCHEAAEFRVWVCVLKILCFMFWWFLVFKGWCLNVDRRSLFSKKITLNQWYLSGIMKQRNVFSSAEHQPKTHYNVDLMVALEVKVRGSAGLLKFILREKWTCEGD